MMRDQPTLRIPLGVLALVAGLIVYCLIVVRHVSPLIEQWHVLAQTPVYVLLGLVWLAPLRRFLIWMETGRWK